MPVFNVIDTRSNEYNSKCDVVFEIFSNTSVRPDIEAYTEWANSVYVYDVIHYAMGIKSLVTVYFYDENKVKEDHGYLSAVHSKIKRNPITIR